MAKLKTRTGTSEDAALIASFGARTFKAAFGPDNTVEDMEQYLAAEFSESHIRALLSEESSTFLIGMLDDAIIGYAMLKVGEVPEVVSGTNPVELVRLYIDQNLLGQGYGSILLGECLEEMKNKGYTHLWLGVWDQNLGAIAFYKRWGFSEVGSHEFVLGGDVQKDLIMVKEIS